MNRRRARTSNGLATGSRSNGLFSCGISRIVLGRDSEGLGGRFISIFIVWFNSALVKNGSLAPLDQVGLTGGIVGVVEEGFTVVGRIASGSTSTRHGRFGFPPLAIEEFRSAWA